MIGDAYIGIIDGGWDGKIAFAFDHGGFHFGNMGMIRSACVQQAKMMASPGRYLGEFKTKKDFLSAVEAKKGTK